MNPNLLAGVIAYGAVFVALAILVHILYKNTKEVKNQNGKRNNKSNRLD
jgi:hypothetical protein